MHASCLAIDGEGVLLYGPSGVGKSDLALRLISQRHAIMGFGREVQLVADDRVVLAVGGATEGPGAGELLASAPQTLAGLLEVRGIGILRLKCLDRVVVRLAVRLVDHRARVERMPDPDAHAVLLGFRVPQIVLYAHEASAPTKVIAALLAVVRPGTVVR
ncbi:MAG: hypothetical protein GC150_14725 [Rhizobiales bacterium]|nr:hypothetical protein [Hyphomicrobiales bacterium]